MAGQSRVSDFQLDDKAFIRGLKEQAKNLTLRTEQDLIALAIDVQNRARSLCPVKTGRLRSSISHTSGRDAKGVYVDVGTNVQYAGHVEFGTRYMAAQPYLRPAMAEALNMAAGRFRR